MSGFSEVKQHSYENQRKREDDVTDESKFLSWTLRLFEGQQVKDHGCPAAIATPSSTEKKWPENLGDEIMKSGPTKNTRSQIEPKTFNLHVFLANQPEKNEHIAAYSELDELSCIFFFLPQASPFQLQGKCQCMRSLVGRRGFLLTAITRWLSLQRLKTGLLQFCIFSLQQRFCC